MGGVRVVPGGLVTGVDMPTIFVADDDPILLRGLDVALSRRGHAVRTVAGGRALLELLEREHPDLVVVDLMMPEMSGLEVLRELRSSGRCPGVPVLVVTAAGDAGIASAACESGAVDVIAKPFRLQDLVRRIESRLERSR
jgi:DNA-binding response OmpR family regulator